MLSKRKIAVTFDLWETLIIDQPELDWTRSRLRYEGLHEVLSVSGISISVDDLRRGYDGTAPILQSMWTRNEHPSPIEQIRIIVTAASGGAVTLPDDPRTIATLEEAYVDPVLVVPPRLNEDAIPTLEGMRRRVSKIGFISNTGRSPGTTLRELLTKLGIVKFFDTTVFSDEAKCRKPDRRIFETAAKGLGADLNDMLHIGDDPEADVWGAKQAGMRALLFDHDVPEGFKQDPNSLFVLSRADRRIPDSEIKPDAKISSLQEALDFIDSL